MGVNLRTDLLNASRIHYEAHIEKHRVNVENLLNNSIGIGEHAQEGYSPDMTMKFSSYTSVLAKAQLKHAVRGYSGRRRPEMKHADVSVGKWVPGSVRLPSPIKAMSDSPCFSTFLPKN